MQRKRRHTPDGMPNRGDMPESHYEMEEDEHRRAMREMASEMMRGPGMRGRRRTGPG